MQDVLASVPYVRSINMALLQTTYSHIIDFVNYFCVVKNQYMLFWLLRDA